MTILIIIDTRPGCDERLEEFRARNQASADKITKLFQNIGQAFNEAALKAEDLKTILEQTTLQKQPTRAPAKPYYIQQQRKKRYL